MINNPEIVFAGNMAITWEEYIELLEKEMVELEIETLDQAIEEDIDSKFFGTTEEFEKWDEDNKVKYSEKLKELLGINQGHDMLKRIRGFERVTQEEMAKLLGITTATYNRKENLKGGDFTISEAIKIAKKLNKKLDEVFPF